MSFIQEQKSKPKYDSTDVLSEISEIVLKHSEIESCPHCTAILSQVKKILEGKTN